MSTGVKNLLLGALKSAVSSATGIIIALNISDPVHFSVKTLAGWKELGFTIGITVLLAEARFWKQWANGGPNGGTGT